MKTHLFKALFFAFRRGKPVPRPEHPAKILVIRQDNRIGNLILATPVMELIKRRWPGARLDVMTGGIFHGVLERNPNIDRIVVYDQLACVRMPWRFFALLFRLRRERYDMVFDLKAVFSFNNLMMTVLSGARYRVGFRNALSSDYFDCAVEQPPDANRYEALILAELLTPFGPTEPVPGIRYVPEPSAAADARALLDKAGLLKGTLIGIHTGGRGAKKLELPRFLEIGKALKNQGMNVVFFFGPDEQTDAAFFMSRGFAAFSPATTAAFGGFLPHLRLFVSCDTGPMHMAAGAGTATLSFFFATAAERYAPRGPRNRCQVIDSGSDLVLAVTAALKDPA